MFKSMIDLGASVKLERIKYAKTAASHPDWAPDPQYNSHLNFVAS